MTHLTDRIIEALVERDLPTEERAAAEAHLGRCARCREAVEATREFFVQLEGLPVLDPSPRFTERVMSQVRIQPAAAPFWARLLDWLPSTRRGWRWAAAAAAVPALLGATVLIWLITMPALSPAAVARWTWVWLADAAVVGLAELSTRLGGSLNAVVRGFVDLGAVVPLGLLTMFILASLLATPVSAWSLARLLRTPHEEGTRHAH